MYFRKIIIPVVVLLLLFSSIVYSQPTPFTLFEARPASECTVLIRWETIAAMDTLKYEVERSKDMKNWQTIGREDVKSSHRYLVMDKYPGDSLNYYRVKQVGNHGRFVYSEIKWVQVDETANIFIWPNPAKNTLHVKTPFFNGSIDITDANGRLIQKIVITNYIMDIPVANLSKGVYFLYIRYGSYFVTEKFVKE